MDPTDLAIEYARQILDLVEAAQTRFLATMARNILTTGGSPWYDTTQFAYWSALRAHLARQLGDDWEAVLARAQRVLDQARDAGQGQAEQDLTDLYANRPREWIPPQQTLAALGGVAADTLTALTAIPAVILRDADDVYRSALTTPVATTVAGATTTRQALRDALTDFAARGVTGFTDRAGRNWTLDAYTEMAVRTGTLNAHRWGYEQTITAAGEDLVMVTGHGYTCPLCAPWQGTVLSLTGAHPRGWHTLPSATAPDATVRVYVSATIAAAKDSTTRTAGTVKRSTCPALPRPPPRHPHGTATRKPTRLPSINAPSSAKSASRSASKQSRSPPTGSTRRRSKPSTRRERRYADSSPITRSSAASPNASRSASKAVTGGHPEPRNKDPPGSRSPGVTREHQHQHRRRRCR